MTIRVLVTRPLRQGKTLCEMLNKAGATVYHFPTIDFQLQTPHLLAKNTQCLTICDWVILISPQAVFASSSFLADGEFQIACIGDGTKRALLAESLPVHCSPPSPFNSEQLLAQPEFVHVAGKNIAIIQGEGGRDVLRLTLEARGACVYPIIAYFRVLPMMDVRPYQALLAENAIDVIVCTSGESIRNLKTLIGELYWESLRQVQLLVVGKRQVGIASELGFAQEPLMVENPDDRLIVAALIK